jgi:cytochrome c oxidase subunit 2
MVTKEEAITEAPSVTVSSTVEPTDAMKTGNTIMKVEMEAGSFYYKPNIIKAKKGSKIKITFKSVDMMHNFNIDELGVKSPTVKSGNTESFEFTASKAGTFEYYCAVGKHRQNGQVGKLIVE